MTARKNDDQESMREPEQPEEVIDEFDPEHLRYSEAEYASADVDTREVITAIKVRKPGKQEWFRLHEKLILPTTIFHRESKNSLSGEPWLVQPKCREMFKPKDLSAVCLQLAMSSVDTVFLWDRKVARKGEESSDYLMSLETIAEAALKSTVRMEWDNANRCYKFEYATADLGEPDWPTDRTMADWTRLAFRDRNINREDHPVVVEYRTGKPAA